MSVKLRLTLPTGDRNGLDWLTEELRNDPEREVVAVVGLTVRQLVDNLASADDPHVTITGIAWVEALTGMDADGARGMADVAYERRTGKVVLPFGSVLDFDPHEPKPKADE